MDTLEAVLKRIVEAQLSHSDIRDSLQGALRDKMPDDYPHVMDVYGDDESGDVVYSHRGGTKKASYSIASPNGKRAASVDTDSAVKVSPRMVYDERADDEDHMTSKEAFVERFPGSKDLKGVSFAERFVSKSERDNADASDFAGEGKSFPILKREDVMAAVRSIGRGVAGGQSAQKLKNRIKSIAKRKGWASALPKSWQDESDDSKEATTIEITGDVVALKEGAVGQDGTAALKLIAPGWGSSGYYSPELLKRDGPKAFPAGTKNFWNHQTAAEEAARPEGDLRDLASVLTEDARYDEHGPAGPGLYAKANVVPHYREHVDSLAKHIGMSIRASGKAKEGSADGRKGQIIEQLTKGHSVDYVTAPGAGGKILQLFEAARGSQSQHEGEDMDETTVRKLIKEATDPLMLENKRLREHMAILNGPSAIREAFGTINLPEASKERITKRLLESIPLTESGSVDAAKLKTMVENEAKEEAKFLEQLGYGKVYGMGVSGATESAELSEADFEKEVAASFQRMGLNESTAKIAAKGRAA